MAGSLGTIADLVKKYRIKYIYAGKSILLTAVVDADDIYTALLTFESLYGTTNVRRVGNPEELREKPAAPSLPPPSPPQIKYPKDRASEEKPAARERTTVQYSSRSSPDDWKYVFLVVLIVATFPLLAVISDYSSAHGWQGKKWCAVAALLFAEWILWAAVKPKKKRKTSKVRKA